MINNFKIGDKVEANGMSVYETYRGTVSQIYNTHLFVSRDGAEYEGCVRCDLLPDGRYSAISKVNWQGETYLEKTKDVKEVEVEEPKDYIVLANSTTLPTKNLKYLMSLKEAEEKASKSTWKCSRTIYKIQPITSFTPTSSVVRKDLT